MPATVCPEGAPAGVSLGYYNYAPAEISPLAGTTDIDRFSVDVGLTGSERFAFGFAYRGTHLNEAGAELQTNGYLHTFVAPIHLKSAGDGSGWRLSIAPALSGSSNVVKDPAEWEPDAWQLLAAVVAFRPLNAVTSLRYGICGDHSFGEYRLYPVVGLDRNIGRRWRARIGFPRAHVAFAVSASLESRLGVAPAGNAWLVKDRALANQSMLIYEAWGIDWELRWLASPGWQLAAAIGYEFDSSYEATLADGQRGRFDAEPTLRLGLRLLWKW